MYHYHLWCKCAMHHLSDLTINFAVSLSKSILYSLAVFERSLRALLLHLICFPRCLFSSSRHDYDLSSPCFIRVWVVACGWSPPPRGAGVRMWRIARRGHQESRAGRRQCIPHNDPHATKRTSRWRVAVLKDLPQTEIDKRQGRRKDKETGRQEDNRSQEHTTPGRASKPDN